MHQLFLFIICKCLLLKRFPLLYQSWILQLCHLNSTPIAPPDGLDMPTFDEPPSSLLQSQIARNLWPCHLLTCCAPCPSSWSCYTYSSRPTRNYTSHRSRGASTHATWRTHCSAARLAKLVERQSALRSRVRAPDRTNTEENVLPLSLYLQMVRRSSLLG